jgi:hypothetical protein
LADLACLRVILVVLPSKWLYWAIPYG